MMRFYRNNPNPRPMPPQRRWTSSEKRSVGARQEWKCAHCGGMLPATFEVDHVRALHLGGADCVETNAEALCNACHANKTLQERLVMEKRRTEAILKAKAEAKAEVKASRPPLKGREPLLQPEPGIEFEKNMFLRFAFVPTQRR